jgi:transporter, monovalent cation:proton antiporter-2 (CPA2) family
MDSPFLTHAVLYLTAALVAVTLFRKLGLGAILGYLFAGTVLGPDGLGFIHDPEHTLHFAEFGVVMLLFVIGLELNPEKLWQMRRHIMLLGIGQVGLCAGVIAAVLSPLTGMPWGIAILLGLTLALSSTAFAIQLMEEHNIMGSPVGRKGFAILLLQDLAVIPILLLVGVLAPFHAEGPVNPWWYGPAAVVLVLLVGRYAIHPLLRAIAETGIRELFPAAALLIVLGTALLMQATGLTMGMGAFLAGIILGNSSFRHQLEADIEPFKGLLLGLFFIAVGMNLDLDLLLREPLLILGAALALMLTKAGVIAVLIRLSRGQWREAFLLGLILSQGGEFAFVVMSKSLDLGLLSDEVANRVNLVVGLSMALTGPLVMVYRRLARQKPVEGEAPKDTIINDEPEVIIAGFGRFGQIVGRLLAANHLKFTALDQNADNVEFIKRFGSRVFYGDARRPDVLLAAGVAHARIFVIALNNPAGAVAIAHYLKEHHPNILVIARARDRSHAYQLLNAGVKHVVREALESSLVAASHTLEHLGYTETQTKNMVNIFRTHDQKLLMQVANHQNDSEELIKILAEGKKELENLFASDKRS